MQLSSKQVSLIEADRKTTIRRRIPFGQTEPPYQAGDTIPITSKTSTCRVEITDIAKQTLHELTQLDAISEGFKTRAQFADHWMRTHNPAYARQPLEDDQAIWELFNRRFADALVWVLHIKRDITHRPVLLTPAARPHGSELGYTSQPAHAMKGEPEAVAPAVLDFYAKDAAERHLDRPGRREDALRRRANALAKRLREDAITTLRQGHDIVAELDEIERHLNMLKKSRAA